LREDGSIELIRRAQTIDDYFATLKYPGSLL
jgi:diaminopimelate decarboxylase